MEARNGLAGALPGAFVLVVGPSGAGKDTLIGLARSALAGDPRFVFPRRVVTRDSGAGEAHDTLDTAAFDQAERDGAFCLSWRAHGLGYGIPKAAEQAARDGAVVVCNVSRTVIPAARASLPRTSVVEVTAPAEVLEARVAARRRDGDGDPRARTQRQVAGQAPDLTIVNTGAPESGAARLLAHLEEFRTPVAEAFGRRHDPGPG
jgi:ribose 1,5-bisphosphokinase